MALTGAQEQPGNFLGKRRRYSKGHLQIKGSCERGLFPLSCPVWMLPTCTVFPLLTCPPHCPLSLTVLGRALGPNLATCEKSQWNFPAFIQGARPCLGWLLSLLQTFQTMYVNIHFPSHAPSLTTPLAFPTCSWQFASTSSSHPMPLSPPLGNHLLSPNPSGSFPLTPVSPLATAVGILGPWPSGLTGSVMPAQMLRSSWLTLGHRCRTRA